MRAGAGEIDLTASRPLMDLKGGSMALALGADYHRDTTRDDKLEITNTVTYAGASPSHGEGARNVAAIFASGSGRLSVGPQCMR